MSVQAHPQPAEEIPPGDEADVSRQRQIAGRPLADLRAELAARVAGQAKLESLHHELRSEFSALRAALEGERAQRGEVESKAVVLAAELADLQAQVLDSQEELSSLRARLEASETARDDALAEAGELRVELERLGGQLATALERTEKESLAEAEGMLAEARALTASLRRDSRPGLSVAPDPDDKEAAPGDEEATPCDEEAAP